MTKKMTGACLLVDDGLARAGIVLDADLLPLCRDAVQELVTGIAKSTGVRIFIDGSAVFMTLLEPARPAPVAIRFELAAPAAKLGKDGFAIKVAKDLVVFAAGGRVGFFNAVHYFLERHCGFRWLWPGADGEVYDKLDRLSLPVGEITEKPDYHWRHLLLVDMPEEAGEPASRWQIQEFHMRPSRAANARVTQWLRRNRMGGLQVVVGHTWGRFVSPEEFGREHPEYFAQVAGSRQNSINRFSGKHGGQLCTSNPEVIDLLVRRIREHFDRFPEIDVISISPNDGTAICECDACIARDVHFGNPPPGGNGERLKLDETLRDDADQNAGTARITGPVTDRFFEFANRVAEKIAVTHPDKKLLLLVYGPTRTPPRRVVLADNVIAQFCVHCHRHWSREWREADYALFENLAGKTRETGIYEYYEQGIWPGLPRSFPDLIVDSIRFFHQHGARHYSAQASAGFAANGVNLWVLARALWDVAVDVDALLEDYCRKGFAASAAPMRDYFELWRARWRDCAGLTRLGDKPPGVQPDGNNLMPFEQLLRLYPESFLSEAAACLERARVLVPPLSAERRRIDFCARGLEGTEIALTAARRSYALRDRGWPMCAGEVNRDSVAALGPAQQVREQALDALRLWGRWEALLENSRDDFVFSFFWARYCLDGRKRLHPHYALQCILDVVNQ